MENNQGAIYGILIILSILSALLVVLVSILVWAALKKFESLPAMPALFDPKTSNIKKAAEEKTFREKIEVIELSDKTMVPNKQKDKGAIV